VEVKALDNATSLEWSEAREVLDFRQLFEAVPGLYLVRNPDLAILAGSDAYLRAQSQNDGKGQHFGAGSSFRCPDAPNPAGVAATVCRTSCARRFARCKVPSRCPMVFWMSSQKCHW